MFDTMDADGDGKVTLDEVYKYLHNKIKAPFMEALPQLIEPIKASFIAMFDSLDANGDGKLQPDEFAAMKQNEAVTSHIDEPEDLERFCNFAAADADGDGEVSKEEFWSHAKRTMKKQILYYLGLEMEPTQAQNVDNKQEFVK